MCIRDRVGNYKHFGSSAAVDSVVSTSETHRTRACENSHIAAFGNAHVVCIYAGLCVVASVISADNARCV